MRDNVTTFKPALLLAREARIKAIEKTTPSSSSETKKEEPLHPTRVLLIEPEIKLRAQLFYHFRSCGYAVTVARQQDEAGYDIAGVTRPIKPGKAAFDLIILGEEGNPHSKTSVADKLINGNRFNIPVLLLTANESLLNTYSPDARRRTFSCAYSLDRKGLLRDEKGRLTAASMDTVHDMAENVQRSAQQVKAQFPPLER